MLSNPGSILRTNTAKASYNVPEMKLVLRILPGWINILLQIVSISLFNEILFNPSSDGVDYVEIYNRSTNIIDLKQLYIANRSSTGVISSIMQLSARAF